MKNRLARDTFDRINTASKRYVHLLRARNKIALAAGAIAIVVVATGSVLALSSGGGHGKPTTAAHHSSNPITRTLGHLFGGDSSKDDNAKSSATNKHIDTQADATVRRVDHLANRVERAVEQK